VRGQLYQSNSDLSVFSSTSFFTATANDFTTSCIPAGPLSPNTWVKACFNLVNGRGRTWGQTFSDSTCSTAAFATNIWWTFGSMGAHPAWPGFDRLRQQNTKITQVSNRQSDIDSWNAACACGGTWALGTARTVMASDCSASPQCAALFMWDFFAGQVNATTGRLRQTDSHSDPMAAMMDTTVAEWGTMSTVACTDYVAAFPSLGGAGTVAPSVGVLAIAIIAIAAAKRLF